MSAKETPQNGVSNSWSELRDLITEPEQKRLDELQKRLDDPVLRAEEISRVLPDALTLGTDRDQNISRALQSTIDNALRNSVRKNPKALADAIYPSLGPAIRRAISATLMSMIQSLNQLLNQSFSLQGIRWRFEAIRTKRPFAEIVLLHSLVYRVEQLFLIHAQTGLVLQHVASEAADVRDPDMVSGMLTAIQDFVVDSFRGDTEEQLDTLRMSGDHSVWIERGSDIVLAAVIRGTPPLYLRERFSDLVDRTQKKYKTLLEKFDGQISAFNMLKPQLEDLLAFQEREKRTPISPLLWIFALLAISGIVFGSWRYISAKRAWQHYVFSLKSQSGIVVTAATSHKSGYVIEGFKDPLAPDPQALLPSAGLSSKAIAYRWEPYDCLDDAFVLKRARLRLHPPDGVSLRFSNGILSAKGKAPHRWVAFFKRQAATLPGVVEFDAGKLQDIEMQELKNAIAELERHYILFDPGQSVIEKRHQEDLDRILALLRRIGAQCRAVNVSATIALVGHADQSGSQLLNIALSKQRADNTYRYFLHKGISPLLLLPVGAGVKMSMTAEQQVPSKHRDRSVTFFANITGSYEE